MLERYFPWGIAEGRAFLGRKNEINRLKNNIIRGYHTLLLSPRRYGKTSLAKQAIRLVRSPWTEIDFFIAQDELSIEQKFLKSVQSIIAQVDKPERWINTLVHFLKNANKTWTVGIKGLKLELTPENHKNVPENILEALNALEHILEKKNNAPFYSSTNFKKSLMSKITELLKALSDILHNLQNKLFSFFPVAADIC